MKEKNTKRIIISFSLIIGMIVVATVIAVAAFFMSIPVKHSGRGTDDITTTSSPDVNAAPTPESELHPSTGSKSRDPFLPPPEAWPNLKTIAGDSAQEKAQPTSQRVSSGKASPAATFKKPKTSPGKTPVAATSAPTLSPEPQDPNSPEYKEPLVLPGMSDPNRKNTDIGLKITYKVKKSDTIYRISQKFGIAKETILRENGLNLTTDRLPEGKNLIISIPKSHLYQMKADETLWKIAVRYGATVELLKDINNITDSSKIGPGQTIILPVSANNKQHP